MIGIGGSGPAAKTAAAVLESQTKVEHGSGPVDGVEAAIVVGDAGSSRFDRATSTAATSGTPWFAIERGGLGGLGIVDAAVTGFGPDGASYADLRTRVRATQDEKPPARDVDDATLGLAGAVAAYEVMRVLAGAHSLGRVVVLPYEQRTLLPVPEGERDRRLRRDDERRDLETALAHAEQALDPLVGIVQEVGEAESWPAPYYLAQSCSTAAFSDATAPRQAAGVAADWNSAYMKALGEALERYCAGVYRETEFDMSPPGELEQGVGPASFVCEHEPANEPIPWVSGENLHTGESVMLPAEFVHYPPPEQRFRSAVTTGLGLGNSGAEAILSGLYEVIERDAAMLAWYSTFEPMEIDISEEGVKTLRARARSEDLSVTVTSLTMDIDVPVVAAAVHRDEWPRFALGTDADFDLAAAAQSALAEALQNWMELRGMGPEAADDASGAIGEYAALPGRAHPYVDPPVSVSAGDLADAPSKGEGELEAVLDRIAAADCSAYAARTTTDDVATLGFEAVRALVPAAQPLCFGEMVFGERARAVPESLGFEPRLERAHHPYP